MISERMSEHTEFKVGDVVYCSKNENTYIIHDDDRDSDGDIVCMMVAKHSDGTVFLLTDEDAFLTPDLMKHCILYRMEIYKTVLDLINEDTL